MNAAGSGTVAESDPSGLPEPRGSGVPAGHLAGLVSGLSRQNSMYRRMMTACDRLAGAAVQGADAAELAMIFAEAAGKTVVLLDPDLRLAAQASGASSAGKTPRWDPGDPSIVKLLDMLVAERRSLRVPPVPRSALAYGCLATPVIAGDAVLGYLLVLDEASGRADDADLIVTSYAAIVFALALARTQSSLELGLRYRGAIVDSLVSGHFLDIHDARRKARILGVADAQPFRIAVARMSGPPAARRGRLDESELAEELLTRLAASLPYPTAIRGPELVMLVPEQPPADIPARNAGGGSHSGAQPAASPARQLLRHQGDAGELTCGLSELTLWPELAPQALRQAQHAIDLGIRLGRSGQTTSYEELGIYRLLLQIGDMQQLWHFASDVLGSLIDYDTRHKADLVNTLSAYLNQRESLKQTARVLQVHVNTVTYRIQRIEQLTSLDLTNPDHRLSAHVAAKIIESQRPGKA